MTAAEQFVTDRALPPSRLLPADLTGPDFAAHQRCHGPLPTGVPAARWIADIEAAGLTGRGGARFPVHRKLRAVARGRRPVVVANAAEGEPSSKKDRTLLRVAPHLVLDGLQVTAMAVGASRAIVYVHEGPLGALVRAAVAERGREGRGRLAFEVVEAPPAFVSGEESAVVSRIDGGLALPRTKPPMVFEKGVGGRATLVQNVETLAHVALIARHGAAWFRRLGTAAEPGTMLCTVSGAVAAPGVLEVPLGTPVRQLLAAAGGPLGWPRGVLVGGFHGAWLDRDAAARLAVSFAELQTVGATPGAGVVVVLGEHECPLEVSARVMAYLAQQSARQCGPCLNGLPALAATMGEMAGLRWDAALSRRLEALAVLLPGRGACHHPDGSVRFARSTLAAFPDEVAAHRGGRCLAVPPSGAVVGGSR